MGCSGCHALVRELYGTLCERCHYGKEVNDQDEKELKAEANKGLPSSIRERETKPDALVGQMTLGL
jgi:hypothetical protein